MQIALTPCLDYRPLTLARAGDTLVLNGALLDLSVLPEGALLPAEAVDCPWLAPGSTLRRMGGVLHLTLIRPYAGGDAPAPSVVTLANGVTLSFGVAA